MPPLSTQVSNASKAAELLRPFTDDSIDERRPFRAVKHPPLEGLTSRDIELLYLNLKKAKTGDR